MGMTNGQFKSFIRLVLNYMHEVFDEMQDAKPKEKLQKIIDILQQSLED